MNEPTPAVEVKHVSCPALPLQKVELKAETVLHLGKVDAGLYPLAKKKTSYEFLREKAHLRPRTNTIGTHWATPHAPGSVGG